MTYLIISALALSCIANLFLIRKIKKTKVNQTLDAELLLRDILRGNGLVRIERVATEDVLLRSVRR